MEIQVFRKGDASASCVYGHSSLVQLYRKEKLATKTVSAIKTYLSFTVLTGLMEASQLRESALVRRKELSVKHV